MLGADYEEFETRCDGIDNDCSGVIDMSAPRVLLVGPGAPMVPTYEFRLVESPDGDLFGAWGAAGDGRAVDAGAWAAFVHRFDEALHLTRSTRLPASPHPYNGILKLEGRPAGGYFAIDDTWGRYAVWSLDRFGELEGFLDAGYTTTQPGVWREFSAYLAAPDDTILVLQVANGGNYLLDRLFTDGGFSTTSLSIPGLSRVLPTVAFAVDGLEFAVPAITDAGVGYAHYSWDAGFRDFAARGEPPTTASCSAITQLRRALLPGESIAIYCASADGGQVITVGADAGEPWTGVTSRENPSQLDVVGAQTALVAVEPRAKGERLPFFQHPGGTRIYAPPWDGGQPSGSNHLTQLKDGGLYFTYMIDRPPLSLSNRTIYGVRVCR